MLASDEEWQDGRMDPLEWCKRMQDLAEDESTVLVYYKLAELWMRRRDERGKV